MQKHYSAFITYKNKNIEICTKDCSTANQHKIWNRQRDSEHGKCSLSFAVHECRCHLNF